jgi:hypothetical protein
MDNFDLKKYLVENKVTINSRMIKENEEDFSVELLVPKVYFNVETGELAETPAAFGARSELKYMDITNYSDGEELIEWVFDSSLEKAKQFEKNYPGLFKVVGGSETVNEGESSIIPNIRKTAALLKQEGIPFEMVSFEDLEADLQHGMDVEGDTAKGVIKLDTKKGIIYVAEYGYGSISIDGRNVKDSDAYVTNSPEEMLQFLKQDFL